MKEYRNKFQPDMSLSLETAWVERKSDISKNFKKKIRGFHSILVFFFRPMQLPYRLTCHAEFLFGILL
jgi:hypothetical protein